MKKTFAKILSITLVLCVLLTLVPVSVFAEIYKPPTQTTDSAVYYIEDGVRTGLMNVNIDGFNYYDISDDKSVDVNTSYLHSVLDDLVYYQDSTFTSDTFSILDQWADIAGAIFEQGGKYTCTHDYSDYYGKNHSNKSDEQVDIATILSYSSASSKGERKKDNYGSTGLSVTNSLSSLRQKMCDDIAYRINRKTCDGSDILGQGNNCPDALTALDDSTTRDVIYNIATSITREGSTAKYQYNSYGIAFYDFDLMILADEGFEYVTGAESYKDCENPVEAAANAGVDGFEYRTSTSQTDIGSCVNQSILGVNESITLSTSQSQSVSTSIANSENYSFSQMIGGELEFKLFGQSAKASTQFTFNQAYESVHTKEATKTVDISSSYSTQTYVPPQTVAYVKQNNGESSVVIPYQTPVALTYKVAVFSMSGDVYADSGLTLAFSTAGYEQSNFSTIFGGSTSESGFYAYESLKNKLDNANISGWDATYGNNHFFYKKHDGGSDPTDTSDKDLNWNAINTSFLNLYKGYDINYVATKVPMLSAGTTMSVQGESSSSEVYDPLPLYLPTTLRVINNTKQSYRILQNGTFMLNTISVGCFNQNNVEYYPFKFTDGHWELCEGSEDILELTEQGYVIGKNPGRGHLRWVLNDDIVYTAEYEAGTVTSKDLTPITIAITVYEKLRKENFSVKVPDEFKGTVGDEAVNVNDLLEVVDENGATIDYAVKWEATCDENSEKKFELIDNMITFSSTDPVKVRAIVHPDSVGENATDWVEVTPREEREIVSADMDEIPADKVTLFIKYLKTHTEIRNAKFDIPAFVNFYDQYGDKWQGEKPEIEVVADNSDGVHVDDNQVLTVLDEGEYNVIVKSNALPDPVIGTVTFTVEADVQHEIGDANGDNYRTIKDVTTIQKYLAQLINAEDIILENADANSDGKVTIADATTIQKYLASIIAD